MNINDIGKHDPYFDPSRYLQDEWEGTDLDILKHDSIPAEEKVWIVAQDGWIDRSILSQFSRNCALSVIGNWNAPQIVIDFLKSGDESLLSAALDAVRSAARSAAASAAWDAALGIAVWDVAWSAAWSAAGEAAEPDRSAAAAAAWDSFISDLIQLVEVNNE